MTRQPVVWSCKTSNRELHIYSVWLSDVRSYTDAVHAMSNIMSPHKHTHRVQTHHIIMYVIDTMNAAHKMWCISRFTRCIVCDHAKRFHPCVWLFHFTSYFHVVSSLAAFVSIVEDFATVSNLQGRWLECWKWTPLCVQLPHEERRVLDSEQWYVLWCGSER